MTAQAATQEVYPMPSAHFDTLAYCKKLKAAGVTEAQAEVHAEALAETIDEKLATKRDLKELEKELRREIQEMGYKLAVRVGSMMVVLATILTILNQSIITAEFFQALPW